MAAELPTGVVTLLFTDIESSTEFWERLGDRFHQVLEAHNDLFREALQRWNGYEVKTEGDSFMLSFPRASDAVQFAIDVQERLAQHSWPEEIGEVLVRMGMHTGEPLVGQGSRGKADYFGPAVNRAARIAAAGHGGQILLSAATRVLALPALPPEVEFLDLGQHWLKGLDRPENIFQVRPRDTLSRKFPPLKTLDSRLHNLPEQLTTFVGRQREMAEVVAILKAPEPEVRLLTLVGPGGTGKTRLALQVASEMADEFGDGVWFVELAEARETEEALSAITSILGLSLQPDQDTKRQLQAFLAQRRLLLVLDNSEQLCNAGPLIADLLRAGPGVKCIVTSRALLRVRGETVYEVPMLPVPPLLGSAEAFAFRRTSPSELAELLPRYDSVALFIERAQAVNRAWRVTADNAEAVAELCRRLEGIPLALELAAARAGSLAPQDILYRLKDRFKVLASRFSDLPERQRTLRGAMDWSYDLLAEEERDFLAQLSVFAGGFFKGAAEEITDNLDAIDLIEELRSKSLLSAREVRGYMRFFMLDAVRDYAIEKRLERGLADIAERHSAYFLCFAEKQAAKARTPQEHEGLEQMEEDLDNLRAAMDWAAANDSETCARLGLVLNAFLSRRGLWEEATARAEAGVAAAVRTGDSRLVARLQLSIASLCGDRGDNAAAQSHAEQSLNLAREAGDSDTEAATLNLLGIIACDEDRPEEAEAYLQDSLQLRRSLGDSAGQAMSLHNLARLAQKQGQTHEASTLYEQALALRRDIGDHRGTAETLLNLGVIHEEQKDYAEAREHYEECLSVWKEFGDEFCVAICQHNLGEVALAEGDRERALACLTEAEGAFRTLGSPLALASAALLEKLR